MEEFFVHVFVNVLQCGTFCSAVIYYNFKKILCTYISDKLLYRKKKARLSQRNNTRFREKYTCFQRRSRVIKKKFRTFRRDIIIAVGENQYNVMIYRIII